MRISDWSSDVCSSDLSWMHRVFSKCWSSSIDGVKLVNIDAAIERANSAFKAKKIMALQHSKFEDVDQAMASQGINSVKVITMRQAFLNNVMRHMVPGTYFSRSEERCVGQECVSTCRSGWSPHH